MPTQFRIGTWNLERSGVQRTARIPKQLDAIRRRDADVWVLTETHSNVALEGYKHVASQRDFGYHKDGESCVTIWSRFPLRKITCVRNASWPFIEYRTMYAG